MTRLLIAVPAYGGMVHVEFMASLIALGRLLQAQGIDYDLMMHSNESLITRARNRLATTFMAYPAFTHLLFIDADSKFQPKDILRMIKLDVDVIALPYSKKEINWSKVMQAVKKGLDPSKHTSSVNVNAKSVPTSQAIEVEHVGTGTMLIARKVFTSMQAAHPDWQYTQMLGEGTGKAWAFFHTGICPETHHYLSEDYAFCDDVRALGHRCWLLLNAVTTHYGSYGFHCDLGADIKDGIEP